MGCSVDWTALISFLGALATLVYFRGAWHSYLTLDGGSYQGSLVLGEDNTSLAISRIFVSVFFVSWLDILFDNLKVHDRNISLLRAIVFHYIRTLSH